MRPTTPYRATDLPTTLPRAIARRPDAMGAVRWLLRLFIVPHTLVGVGLVVAFCVQLLTLLIGVDSSGVVESSHVSRSKNTYHERVTYSYEYGGHVYHGNESISLGAPASPPAGSLKPGQTVKVRHLGVGELRNQSMSQPGEEPPLLVLPVLFLMLFWNGILSVFFYTLWYLPLRARWLYRQGTAVPGQILSREVVRGKSTGYKVGYSYTGPSGEHLEGSMNVSTEKLWNRVHEGQQVTVLHHPRRPGASVVYECGDYEWATTP